jgi:hypothetical protein
VSSLVLSCLHVWEAGDSRRAEVIRVRTLLESITNNGNKKAAKD